MYLSLIWCGFPERHFDFLAFRKLFNFAASIHSFNPRIIGNNSRIINQNDFQNDAKM
jgi:hypothetical protein